MFTLCLSNHAQAVAKKDVLICAVPDGSKFILQSHYDWSPVPLPVYHHSRESGRTGWGFTYQDRQGQLSELDGSASYNNKTKSALEHACANVGMKFGMPLAPFTFQREDGSWNATANFPMKDLDVHPSQGSEETRRRMEQAGIVLAEYHFGLILKQGQRLTFEKQLYRSKEGEMYTLPVAAVLQAISEDGGKTWSEPIVTEDAQIFDIGKGWIEQRFRARPVSLNGKPLQ